MKRSKIGVSILGVFYTIDFTVEKDDESLIGAAGYSQFCNHFIAVDLEEGIDVMRSESEWLAGISTVVLHELIHCFLAECGLGFCTIKTCERGWALNEEMVDWFAIQIPKINDAHRKVMSDFCCEYEGEWDKRNE